MTPNVWPKVWLPEGWVLEHVGLTASFSGSIDQIEKTRGVVEANEMTFSNAQGSYISRCLRPSDSW